MSQYDNTNRGVLFVNSRKSDPKHADRKGTIHVQCPHCNATTEFWFDAWDNTNPDGQPRINVKIKAKDGQSGQQSAQPAAAGTPAVKSNARPLQQQVKPSSPGASGVEDMDDEIPF